ncbi:hypothetical protein K461DRAFT_296500 [Myriangium duriaei CBS 260.36]|uniref:Uncharacterized protein n=1 Tax=Myriangium duriaei CBS 260.36 TaxID=1168546 RepID=A0A9P4MHK8_9PEZI|nr:hypothetical protein K461DRAFT_296500 [Myriangium duriaei CBS 260.36]
MIYTLPCDLQQESPLLSLPPELRNYISELCLTSSKPIVNPLTPKSNATPETSSAYRSVPPLGAGLLATCQRVRHEVSKTALYANDLNFTTPSHITGFIETTPSDSLQSIQRITLSMRETPLLPVSTDGSPSSPLALQWLHFLTCLPPHLHYPGSWCSKLPTLPTSLPNLQHLRIDLTGMVRNRPAEMAYLGIKTGYALALSHLLRGLAHRPPVSFDYADSHYSSVSPFPTDDDSHANSDWMYAPKNVGQGRVPGLRIIEITGNGAHLWDLGDAIRPTCWGEWQTIQNWIVLVGRTLIPWLSVALDPSLVAGKSSRRDSAGPEMLATPWVGLLQAQNEFSLAALPTSPNVKELRRLGYERATAWEEIIRLTKERERFDHPVFALFI